MRPVAVPLPTKTFNEATGEYTGQVALRLPEGLQFSDDEFFNLCQANDELKLERSATGEIIVMPPTGGETGNRNSALTGQLYVWTKKEPQTAGALFDSSTGFKLPNGAERSPDVSWVRRERLLALTAQQRQKFLPLCPDFAIELLSPNDSLAVVQAKMEEYLANGLQLGWLLDPKTRTVYVYRPQQPVQQFADLTQLSGDPELPGFVLELTEIWQPSL